MNAVKFFFFLEKKYRFLRKNVNFFLFSSNIFFTKQLASKTIIYTTEREGKIIDSESCVNVREWCACVNMGDRLLSMFV